MAVTIVTTTSPTGSDFVVLGQPTSTDLTIPAITGYTPQLGDMVVVLANCETAAVTLFSIADWSMLGGSYQASTTNMAFVIGHAITADEVTAGTNSWVIPGLFTGAATGRGVAVVVRGAGGSFTSGASTGNVAAVAPQSVSPARDGALILSYVAPDDRARGIGDPGAGWSVLQKASGVSNVPSQLLSRRLVNAAGGVAVDMTNAAVSLNSADEWVSLTVAISPPASTSGFFAVLS